MSHPTPQTYEINFPSRTAVLTADLTIPDKAQGVILFAHGSGSNRFSPRNKPVAQALNDCGFATMLADLLTETEDLHPEARFDVELLTRRLSFATDWVRNNPTTSDLPIGYFGASTGAAAALAAASRREDISAVVSRGGRPDLAGPSLRDVTCPTLLIVGGADRQVLALNQQAHKYLAGEKRMAVIPGATHLFEEPGALDAVVELASDWFARYVATVEETRRAA